MKKGGGRVPAEASPPLLIYHQGLKRGAKNDVRKPPCILGTADVNLEQLNRDGIFSYQSITSCIRRMVCVCTWQVRRASLHGCIQKNARLAGSTSCLSTSDYSQPLLIDTGASLRDSEP